MLQAVKRTLAEVMDLQNRLAALDIVIRQVRPLFTQCAARASSHSCSSNRAMQQTGQAVYSPCLIFPLGMSRLDG